MTSNKRKLIQFKEINTMPCVWQHLRWHSDELVNHEQQSIKVRDKWNTIFPAAQPLLLELACGKAEYTTQLAMQNPKNNYIGIDIKGNRLWHGAQFIVKNNLTNCLLLRFSILHITRFFAKNSIREIWITFADPFPNKIDIKKRLVAPRFLLIYQELLEENGVLHIKHDDASYMQYALEVLPLHGFKIVQYIDDIYKQESVKSELNSIQTFYESNHLRQGKTIKYLQAQKM